jgi:PilZ domain
MSPQEKRKSRRIRIGQPLKIRPTDPKDAEFQETSTTKNVSREGIYFISQIANFREGMRVFVVLPHHSPEEPQDREYLGQVVRMEKLSDEKWGVAVQLLSEVRAK